jgi:hypothetical protein
VDIQNRQDLKFSTSEEFRIPCFGDNDEKLRHLIWQEISHHKKIVQPILYHSTSLTKDRKLKKLEDGRVLQSELSCADNVKHISESTEFRLL